MDEIKDEGEKDYDQAIAYFEEKNYKEAVSCFTKAAEQGHTESQYRLGVLYSEVQDVDQCRTEALKWYKKAAEQGHAPSQKMINNFSSLLEKEQEWVKLNAKLLLATIPNKETALAFVLEEIEAAQYGNEDAKKFAKENDFRQDGNDPLPEIDGPSGPQQTLTKLILGSFPGSSIDEMARLRIGVVKNIIKHWKLDEQSEL